VPRSQTRFWRASGVRGRRLGGPNAILLKIFFKERGNTARNVRAMKGMLGSTKENARTPQNGLAETSVRCCLPPFGGKCAHNRQIKLTKKVKCMYEVEKGVSEDAHGAWGGTWPWSKHHAEQAGDSRKQTTRTGPLRAPPGKKTRTAAGPRAWPADTRGHRPAHRGRRAFRAVAGLVSGVRPPRRDGRTGDDACWSLWGRLFA